MRQYSDCIYFGFINGAREVYMLLDDQSLIFSQLIVVNVIDFSRLKSQEIFRQTPGCILAHGQPHMKFSKEDLTLLWLVSLIDKPIAASQLSQKQETCYYPKTPVLQVEVHLAFFRNNIDRSL